jgi:hypothetical protein
MIPSPEITLTLNPREARMVLDALQKRQARTNLSIAEWHRLLGPDKAACLRLIEELAVKVEDASSKHREATQGERADMLDDWLSNPEGGSDITGQDSCDGSTPAADTPTHEY